MTRTETPRANMTASSTLRAGSFLVGMSANSSPSTSAASGGDVTGRIARMAYPDKPIAARGAGLADMKGRA
jgi:hypothetical protein